jgi:hypothetical protein
MNRSFTAPERPAAGNGAGLPFMPFMERRRLATLATVERYKGKAFSWSSGVTCVHLCRQHLRNMGHQPPSLPRFRRALAAKKALKERGWRDVAAMLDSFLPRIAPAQMLLGDIAILPGEAGLQGIVIDVGGPRRVFGWAEEYPDPKMIEPNRGAILGAWRV